MRFEDSALVKTFGIGKNDNIGIGEERSALVRIITIYIARTVNIITSVYTRPRDLGTREMSASDQGLQLYQISFT